MIKIKFPDGAIKSFDTKSTPFQIASTISHGLARNILSAEFNGKKIVHIQHEFFGQSAIGNLLDNLIQIPLIVFLFNFMKFIF